MTANAPSRAITRPSGKARCASPDPTPAGGFRNSWDTPARSGTRRAGERRRSRRPSPLILEDRQIAVRDLQDQRGARGPERAIPAVSILGPSPVLPLGLEKVFADLGEALGPERRVVPLGEKAGLTCIQGR